MGKLQFELTGYAEVTQGKVNRKRPSITSPLV
jgi:hypothetical protein